METKVCTTCGKEKELTTDYFGKHNSTKDGFRNECKECRNQKLSHHWSVDKTQLRCTVCNSYKSVEEFDINADNKHRGCRDRRCKQCKHESAHKRRTTRDRTDQFHRVFVERYQGMRDRAKKYSIPCELGVNDLKELYAKQEGNCAISGIMMTTILGAGRISTNVSVDQIDPRKGYTKDNVQLVCSAVNQMKSDLTIEELQAFCKAIISKQEKC